jgi:hypothetical protein
VDKAIPFSGYKMIVTSVLSLGDRSRKTIVGWIRSLEIGDSPYTAATASRPCS